MSTFPNKSESAGNRHVTFPRRRCGVAAISCSTARKHNSLETSYLFKTLKEVSLHHGQGQGRPLRDNRTETQADSIENIPTKKQNSDTETKNELFKIKTLDLRGGGGGATTAQDGKGTAAQSGKGQPK
ncbi:hypothetical protein Patl1_30480 [Pistacia atlantica]|uniref:Uncharacterized protein n=1 Tax=Pistacia atlantica TaxID=434234 RepID=A0ACC1AAH4_9ROSI|nr:hypothetical protein Patl1_30480 [Pistacia atlantica]